MHNAFEVTDVIVEQFPQKGGWVYVPIPKEYSEDLRPFYDRGLVPIQTTLGSTAWNTSLLPMGDGTHFIALNAKVRKAENISVGDTVSLTFTLRV